MFQNYMKIALRNLKKNSGYALINIFGLTIGMACAILALMLVQFEVNYDRYHEKADQIHQVFLYANLETGTVKMEGSFALTASDLKNMYPEIINTVRIIKPDELLLRHDDNLFIENDGGCADPSIFEVFTFEFIQGNPGTALSEYHSIVLTRKIAEKYFGGEEAFGKEIRINNAFDFMVTGVIENIPENSHLEYDFFIPMEFAVNLGYNLDDYRNSDFQTYVVLDDKANAAQVSQKIFTSYEMPIENMKMDMKFYLTPLARIHLDGSQGILKFILLVTSLAALLILLTSCINFMNLTTARSINRAKEVGLRKVVGSSRFQLVKQFLSESFLQALLANIMALLLIILLLPTLRNILQTPLRMDFLDWRMVSGWFGVMLFTGLAGGIYPAFVLSSFRPVRVLSGSVKKGKQGARFRKVLVIVQFFFSILLIVCTAFSILQIHYLENAYLGFDTGDIYYTRGNQWGNIESVKTELMKNPSILHVTTSTQIPSSISSFTPQWGLTNEVNADVAAQASVGYDYIETFNMKMAEGRFYSRNFTSDTSDVIAVNQLAVKHLGLESPIGKSIYYRQRLHTIIGVVQDFYSFPIKWGLAPLILSLNPENDDYLFVKVKKDAGTSTLQTIRNVLKRFNPDYPVNLQSLEDYSVDEDRILPLVNKVMIFLTFLGIFISCLGLFSLASFMCEQRTKEIGIRKALGASVSRVIVLLSREYIKLLLIANLIAVPVTFFAVKSVLAFFAYRIDMKAWIFIFTGSLVLFLAMISVIFQTIRAALSNPVDSLRYE